MHATRKTSTTDDAHNDIDEPMSFSRTNAHTTFYRYLSPEEAGEAMSVTDRVHLESRGVKFGEIQVRADGGDDIGDELLTSVSYLLLILFFCVHRMIIF